MKMRGFSYQGQPTTLQAGDEMYYDVNDQVISFIRMGGSPSDNTLLMDGNDKFLLYNIQCDGDFWSLARLIGVLHGLQFTPFEETTGRWPMYKVRFHK